MKNVTSADEACSYRDEAASSIPRATRMGAALRLILVVGYDSTRLLKPWIPQAPSRTVNTMSPP
jgi:hypothetical protein